MEQRDLPFCRAGIDFGTTFSTISAIVDDKLTPLILEDTPYIPTVLTIFDGNLVIGNLAKTIGSVVKNYTTYYDLKRWVGVTASSFQTIKDKLKPSYFCEFKDEDCHMSGIGTVKKSFSVKTLICWYIKVLINLFEEKFKVKVTNLNVSVPADYYSIQRSYMRSIVDSLNIKVDRILNEPSAAAIHSIFASKNSDEFLIFDFGGGTFDVSYVRKKNKIIMICDTEGDLFLGGRDIDAAIGSYITTQTGTKLSPLSLAYIKENVISSDARDFNVLDENGDSVQVSFDRQKLTALADPFVKKSIYILEKIVARNNIKGAVISMVGGTSLLPSLQSAVKKFANKTGNSVYVDKDLRLSVSYGCTYLHILTEDPDFIYVDVNSHVIFKLGTYFKPEIVIRKPMPIPYVREIQMSNDFVYNTAIDLYEGESLFFLEDKLLVRDNYSTDTVSKKGEGYIQVYSYDLDGNISIYLTNKERSVVKHLRSTSSDTFKPSPLNFKQIQISAASSYIVVTSLLAYHTKDPKFSNLNLSLPSEIKEFVEKNGGFEKFIAELQHFVKGL
ncbi:heat shock protein 70-like protein [Cordyline virus 3]|uniref:Heat shock protein 70-like protein n=1 Tax=Cordyline virus 3 TaxID=1177752 RepID=L7P047_9CLOS|nr:heat shock protein 70-like protein [Cordyline virus 3]AFJ05058.2 heat shock protein 70-like protein [Cordyline virus 3]